MKVHFNAALKPAADEVLNLYPGIKRNLESLFMWRLESKPSILLIPTREQFLKISGDPLVIAFAVPEQNLIVIDYSKIITRPFSMEATLKHELCHLLLHRHIKRENFPKWMDEGLCQWVSDGIGEIIVVQKNALLHRASLTKRFIPLGELHREFPADERSRLLAYEESKSFVTYLVDRFGRERFIDALNHMKEGNTAGAAIQSAFSIPVENLEKEWHHSLKSKLTWFTFLSYNLYEILFVLMAVITVLAFIRLYFRKKNYVDDDDPEERDSDDTIH
ncbi:MAG: hypothetical protein JRI75_09405 [Deltaproteobacteria bacterium]|nr:hypothetical protein [Deltaproteobacteria bacterium]